MAVDIEPLLLKLSELAPRFGRARDDLQAMVSRGRAQDYKGVMQNARLVLEALLRSLVTEELKQTPGKAMLDELVTKFRQQANAGIVPTNILAHMGTVQAWGNLSAHDHSGSLEDSGVKVGQEEVVASLNSMVAILSWYAEKRNLAATPAGTPAVAPAAAPSAPSSGSKAPLLAVGGLVVLALGAVGFFALSGPKPATDPQPTAAPPEPFAALDAVYATRGEPPPPPACRRASEAPQLAKVAADAQALGLLDDPSAEAAYLLARASPELSKQKAALDKATACVGFAAAEHLAARAAIEGGDLPGARKWLEGARDHAPKWLENRVMLGGLYLQLGEKAAATKEVEGVISANPDYAPAWLLRSSLEAGEQKTDEALKSLCRAAKLGSDQAKKKVAELPLKCP